jgi:molybdenum cofactor synthesis domain-containing protein
MTTMRPIRQTIPLQEALALVLAAARPVERVERVPLLAARDRIIAAAAVAAVDVPPLDRAAMDGYAVRAEDTFGASRNDPRVLRVIAKLFTGETTSKNIAAGECIEIATGAPLPGGADAVVMVAETERADGSDDVRIFTPVYPRQHVGRRGADIQARQTVLQSGDVLNPSRIGALAAIGLTEADVYARPSVAILSTGNEVVEPGATLRPGQIYDINRYTLASIVAAHGGEPIGAHAVSDDLASLTAALDRALAHDLIVFSGGSSVGERDLILDALMARGEILFHGVAVKPRKPTTFGIANGKPVLGMPGYPTSCLSNAYILLVPMLRKMARLPEFHPQTRRVPLATRIVSTTGRHQFYTVRIADEAAVPAFKASGDITSMSQADGYIEIPAAVDIVEAGEMVVVNLF